MLPVHDIQEEDYITGARFKEACSQVFDDTPVDEAPGTVFLKMNGYKAFRRRIAERKGAPLVVVSHNSDVAIQDSHIGAFGGELYAWFGQNMVAADPRAQGIPIGISNPNCPFIGDGGMLRDRVKRGLEKDRLCYLNVSVRTNRARAALYSMFRDAPWVTKRCTNNKRTRMWHQTYLDEMARHTFVLSPEGNGIDCCRTWEAMYLGAIPIVQRSPAMDYFKSLPILFVDRWEQVTKRFLEEAYKRLTDPARLDLSQLHFSSWRRLLVDTAAAIVESA